MVAAPVFPPLRLPRGQMRAAIIDLDGTMVDTAPDFHAAINRMRHEFGLGDLAQETIVNFVGKGSENLVAQVLACDFDAAQVEKYFDAALASYQRHYEVVNGQFSTLYPGVRQGLTEMAAQGIRLACVTNKPHVFAKNLLTQLGLLAHFSLLYGGDSWPRKKPDPMPLLQVCEEFVLAPSSTLVLGDSSNDAKAARAAHCPVWIVPYGYNHGEPVQNIDCDGIVPTLELAAQAIAVHNLRQQQ